MKKLELLFIAVLLLVSARGWTAQAANSEPASIGVSVEAIDFGAVEVGYAVSQSFVVTGYNLKDDINLTIEARNTAFFEVTPASISVEKAANGVTVYLKYKPYSWWVTSAELRLSSLDAEDVIIPVTADPYYPENILVSNSTVEMTALAGGFSSYVGTARFADAQIPPDPNQPVDRAVGDGDEEEVTFNATGVPSQYSLSITGDDSMCFSARIVKASTLANICTVRILYSPNECGTHRAELILHCSSAGVPTIKVPLVGHCDGILGDLDLNGVITIADVTGLINVLLNGSRNMASADMNCDGKISISDVTLLIDHLLNEE